MNTVILLRKQDEHEHQIILKYFPAFYNRSSVPPNSLVIGRYSVLPFYKELVDDLQYNNSKLINSYTQHRYIADLGNWYRDLKDITPYTWSHIDELPDEGPFVVKGETNSKKFQWSTHMFAKNKKEAIDVMCRLQEDGLLCDQQIYFRKYIPLVKLMDGLGGLDVTKEFRFFICDKQVVSGGFYWSNYEEDLDCIPDPNEVPKEFIDKIINLIGNNARFYVVDVAQTANNEWIVIELKKGQSNDDYRRLMADLIFKF
jgi:hypothetical protein